MKVGVFSPYWQTFGGGERYFLTVAEFFLRRGDQVDLFWEGDTDIARIKARFNLDLTGVHFVPDVFFGQGNKLRKFLTTFSYDVIFFVSDGSVPLSFAKQNILHFQVPFNFPNGNNLVNRFKLSRINSIICNSQFTKTYVDRTYGVNSQVVYPPVDVASFSPGKKENIILSVGRFFGPLHPKKQEVLIQAFTILCQKGLKNWRLVLVGGLTEGGENEVARLKKMITRLPIILITDSSFAVLQDYYAKARIYWHATGFGEDLEKYPERAEHFGITTVEAMSAGCVPVVFAGGGQSEIVSAGQNGFFWTTTDELIHQTQKLITDKPLQEKIAKQAVLRSKAFSKDHFCSQLGKLISRNELIHHV